MNLKIVFTLTVLAAAVSCTSKTSTVPPGPVTGKKAYIFSQTALQKPAPVKGRDYTAYNTDHTDGPLIPGLYEGAVPQGMAYDSEKEIMFISNYMFNGKPSSLSVLSMKTGNFTKVLWLYNPDGTPHTGHVGGLAASRTHLWVASGKGVYRISLSSLYTAQNGDHIKMASFTPTAAKGSFASYASGILWVGEFTSKDGLYTTPDSHHLKTPSGRINHAWMAGYLLDKNTDLIQSKKSAGGKVYPDYIISIPDDVQGAAFSKGILILSLSYGRRNKSRLVSFKNPLKSSTKDRFKLPDGTEIPLAVLDSRQRIHTLTAPPMTEGISVYKDSLAVVFESGSDKYRSTALFPQGRIQLLPLKIFRQQGKN